MEVKLIAVDSLLHIEGFSPKRVDWLTAKIRGEGRWTKPLALDADTHLVMDGQHRMEVARRLGLDVVPAALYRYSEVEIWSLRANHEFTWETVVSRGTAGNIYPYKTIKHAFPEPLPPCDFLLAELGYDEATG